MRDLQKLLRPLVTRIANVVSRGEITRVDDAKRGQLVQVELLDGETREDVERPQNYGFTSVPLEGAEVVVVCVGGSRDHAFVVAADDRRHRVKGLEPGEVAVYHHGGSRIVLRNSGNIDVEASADLSVFATGNLNLQADGDVSVQSTQRVSVTAPEIVLNDGTQPIARVGDSVTGTAGPFPVVGVIASGNPTVKG